MIERRNPTPPVDYTPELIEKLRAQYCASRHSIGKRGMLIKAPNSNAIASDSYHFKDVIRMASDLDGLAEQCTVSVCRRVYGEYVMPISATYTGKHARRVIDAIRALYLTPKQRAFVRVVVAAGIASPRKAMQAVEKEDEGLREWMAAVREMQPA